MAVHDILLMTAMLTRLPVPVDHESERPFASSVWAMPLVGAGIGAIVAAIAIGIGEAGASQGMAAVIAIGAGLLLTGCLHEDGLADMADGLGGGRTKERKREIMKDSRLGTYGAAALFTALGLKATAVSMLLELPFEMVFFCLISSGAVSRAAVVAVHILGQPADRHGLAASVAPTLSRLFIALSITICLIAPAAFDLNTFFAAIAVGIAASIVAALTYQVAKAAIDGYTGDILGAIQVLCEVTILCGFSVALGSPEDCC